MIADARTAVLIGFGIGVALASAPGAVQAVLLTEAARGGLARGLRTLIGSSVTWGSLLLAVALGMSFVAPTGLALRVLQLAGGAYLLWLAADGFRSAAQPVAVGNSSARAPAVVLGSLAVLLNPGGWIFLGAVASPLFVSAAQVGGVTTAAATAVALFTGVTLGDAAVVAIGALGIRRAHPRVQLWFRRGLAVMLATLALILLAAGVVSS